MEEVNKSNTEAVKKLKELVEKIRTCMMATVNENGLLSSRPMATVNVDDEGNLWFFTNEHSGKVEDQKYDNTVHLMYADPDANNYVHVHGSTEVITDRKKIKDLWTPLLSAWYPQGVDDPDLCLLKVNSEDARYWDSSSNKMVTFFQMLKAKTTKKKYDEGEVGTLNLADTKRTY